MPAWRRQWRLAVGADQVFRVAGAYPPRFSRGCGPLQRCCNHVRGRGQSRGWRRARTHRAPLGPRLTCALHRVVFMHLHSGRRAAATKARRGIYNCRKTMRIYAPSLCTCGCVTARRGAIVRGIGNPGVDSGKIVERAAFGEAQRRRRATRVHQLAPGLAGYANKGRDVPPPATACWWQRGEVSTWG